MDYLAQADIERVSGARRLRRAYDLIIFPGHHGHVTSREFGLVMGFRNLGGNLMFLSANNFFWCVERDGSILRQIAMWRDLGRPGGARRRPVRRLREPSPRAVRRPSLRPPAAVAVPQHGPPKRIELRLVRDRSRPHDRRVAARSPCAGGDRNGQGRALTGQMTYYTRGNAKVFAAGAFTLGGSATRRYGASLLEEPVASHDAWLTETAGDGLGAPRGA